MQMARKSVTGKLVLIIATSLLRWTPVVYRKSVCVEIIVKITP